MSLINDALKRAQEVQRKDTPLRVSPMLSPTSHVVTRRKEHKVSLALPIVIIFLIVGASAVIGLAMFKHKANGPDKKIDVAPEMAAVQPAETVATPTPTPPPAASLAPAQVASAVSAPVVAMAQPAEATAAPIPNPTPAVSTAPNPPPPVTPASTPSTTPAETTSPVVVQTAPPAQPLPTTLVQGIANDTVHPWAIINGKTVSVGDFVSGMRVVDISHHSVTLSGFGQTKNLVVGEQ